MPLLAFARAPSADHHHRPAPPPSLLTATATPSDVSPTPADQYASRAVSLSPARGRAREPGARSDIAAPDAAAHDADARPAAAPPAGERRRPSSVAKPHGIDGDADGALHGSFLAKVQPALTLVNSGSVARDHLASERTFLAYVRTSLAIASMGVALVQLFKISTSDSASGSVHQFARPLGAVLVAMGLLVLVTGFVRYFTVQHALVSGKFPAARAIITVVSLFLAAVVVTVFGILVGVRSSAS